MKKSLIDQISSNNFINPPVKYHRTAKMTLFKYQSKRSNSHLKTSRLNNLHPPRLLTALRIKSKCLTVVKGLRSDHCSFFLRLRPPWFTDQPPWPCSLLVPSAWWAVPIFFIEHVSVWLAPSHLSDASPSGFPLRDAFSGDVLLSCTVQLCDIFFLTCTPLSTFYFWIVSLSTLDCKLLESRKLGLRLPVGTLTSGTVAMFCPPHSKHPTNTCWTNTHRNEEWAAITTGSGWKGP